MGATNYLLTGMILQVGGPTQGVLGRFIRWPAKKGFSYRAIHAAGGTSLSPTGMSCRYLVNQL